MGETIRKGRSTTLGMYGVGMRPQPYDLNDDGTVTTADITIVLNVFLGTETNATRVARSDLNGDGSVNAGDVQRCVNAVIRAAAADPRRLSTLIPLTGGSA